MKKVTVLILAVSVISVFVYFGADKGYSYESHNSYDACGYDYGYEYNTEHDECPCCNDTGKISCPECCGHGQLTLDTTGSGGYRASEKFDCAYCIGGKTDCTLC